jgi:uncharacterized protein (TIGR03435 family)
MLQNLLIERFHFVSHLETKVLPGYALAVAASGPRLAESVANRGAPEPLSQVGLSFERDNDGFPISRRECVKAH